jgi:hypothetical protein
MGNGLGREFGELINRISDELARREVKERNLEYIANALDNPEQSRRMRASGKGLYTVLWSDKFDYSSGVEGRYKTAEEALRVARKKSKDAMKSASGHGIATVYLAYDPEGKYIGGDTWVGE